MQQNFSNVELLFPNQVDWEQWRQYKSDIPFSDQVIEFLNSLSGSLLKDKESRLYPDVITFAFFCRKANLLMLKKQYQDSYLRLGRGVVFHIAPSNVPINFGYSLVAGLLSGNYNLVRVSSKKFPQVDLIIKHIYILAKAEELQEVIRRIALLRYDRMSDATAFFSSFCNARVIWGGNETIAQIRTNPIPARSFDVTFADRYSIAVLNADKLIKVPDPRKIAEGFYNDTYLFDQNACSAPHLMIWYGETENIEMAKIAFWEAVYAVVKEKYKFQSVLAVDKLTALYRQSVGMSLQKEKTEDNTLIRVKLKELPPNIDEFRCAGGYFSEYSVTSLNEIAGIITDKYQTMAYYGFERDVLQHFVAVNGITGIDRIVPVGTTTEFKLVWDGYDLIHTLSRICTVI